MDFGFGIDGRTDDPAADGAGPFGCVDEFADPMSLEDLAARWRCALKTARAKVIANCLGINPAGTWLVSRIRVVRFEERLRTGHSEQPHVPIEKQDDSVGEKVRAGLTKLGILHSRRRTPDIQEKVGRSVRRVG